jgi:hypothetical protein
VSDENRRDAAEPAASCGGSTSWLCRLGIHSWVTIERKCRRRLRSDIRWALTQDYPGYVESLYDQLVDRVCSRCERRDNQIERAREKIEVEERTRLAAIEKATGRPYQRSKVPQPPPPPPLPVRVGQR